MPFIKFVPEKPDRVCRHPGHNPPGMIVLKPGTYTWKCPACGKTTTFVVRGHHLRDIKRQCKLLDEAADHLHRYVESDHGIADHLTRDAILTLRKYEKEAARYG